jgi:hypothetical protein
VRWVRGLALGRTEMVVSGRAGVVDLVRGILLGSRRGVSVTGDGAPLGG